MTDSKKHATSSAGHEESTGCLGCLKNMSCFGRGSKDERKPLLDDKNHTGGYTATKGDSPRTRKRVDESEPEKETTPISDVQPGKPEDNDQVETIEMKPLEIKPVDDIFTEFQNTFNSFSACQTAMSKAVKEFKTAVKTTGEFDDCLKEFKRQLNGKQLVVKKLVLNVPKAILKGGDSVGSAAVALQNILKAYGGVEKLPAQVTNKSIACVKDVMGLDLTEIVEEEFSGSAFDLGKIPKQMTNMRENLKQIKKAPGIVTSFFQYSTSIIVQVVAVFGDQKGKDELEKRKEKVNKEMKEKENEMEKLNKPELPEEIEFTPLEIPSIDRIFGDIAKVINPVAKLSQDLYDAREKLEKAMKTISEFRDDKTKSFDDYLDELKQRVKKGDIHIYVTITGNHVEVEKVEGLEPNVMRDIQSGLRGVLKSGNEITDLAPDTVKQLIKLVGDVAKVSKSDVKSHVALKQITSTLSALAKNSRKAKTIPATVQFFFCFIRNLLMDILDVVHSKNEEE